MSIGKAPNFVADVELQYEWHADHPDALASADEREAAKAAKLAAFERS
jgi:hypothetical protein